MSKYSIKCPCLDGLGALLIKGSQFNIVMQVDFVAILYTDFSAQSQERYRL